MRDDATVPLEAPADESLGTTLARLRAAAGLTGTELARRVRTSQSKISRLENDKGVPNPREVARLARALDADEAQVRLLVDRAERLHDRMRDWRVAPVGLARRQYDFEQLESTTRVFRVFQPTIIVGLLQTSEYARAVLGAYQHLLISSGIEASGASVLEAVTARMHRQEALADPGKEFHFLMSEAVFANQVCPPEAMPNQIRRVQEVARQDNVTVAVIPHGVAWPMPPYHGFNLLDDRDVYIDLFNTGLTSRGASDGRLYRHIFDSLAALAGTDIDDMLDGYVQLHLDRARSAARRSGPHRDDG